ncbi:uncharacterized protein LOC131859068 [Cryptomeria japonica]|uniref:uncharacterized protein LOC131859068 n=1 Tax=Cryptomeria japonica TaxID=3369 RepID=UPI0027DA210B|nr:uncharacterized protein LOC131859068 [Cryptomeria japonica]
MALSTTFSGGILCTLHNPRVTTAMRHYSLLTASISHTKHSTIIVRGTQDGYAIMGSSKSVKSDSLSSIHTDNAGKASAVADSKSFKFIESLRLPEFLLPITSGESRKSFVKQAEQTIERAIFDFRFLTLLAIAGSLAGSLLCFLNGLPE